MPVPLSEPPSLADYCPLLYFFWLTRCRPGSPPVACCLGNVGNVISLDIVVDYLQIYLSTILPMLYMHDNSSHPEMESISLPLESGLAM